MTPELRQRIESLLAEHPVVLFMKGSPEAPRCGFSAKASGILNGLIDRYHSVDVLSDPEIREGIKEFGSWPTIPQLYVQGELVGGSDIIESMLNEGQLHQLFALPEPDRTPPQITISEQAARMIREAAEQAGDDVGVHMSIDPRFQAQFQLGPIEGHEVVAESAGVRIHFDLASAPRAQGIVIDWVESARGAGLAVRNPNGPPEVRPLEPAALAALQSDRELLIVDTRSAQERAIAALPLAHDVLDESSFERLSALPKDRPIAFLCHHGVSSRRAAEHFRSLGFREVYNIEGGIEAYARDVDASVARY
ncbi:MAG: Grx4 family monothiol glutaredoxin [Xanthomonadales bacterium]|nr:Grx4 family monothiol glutaredoxin [Xanthomonadales bacterium]